MAGIDDELGIESQLLDRNTQTLSPGIRPTFLTVLCILSFIGNGLGFFQGIIAYVMSGVYANMFRMMSKVRGIQREMDQIYDVITMMGWWGLTMVVGSLICLLGAILMWRLKKSGFIIYLIGQALPIIMMLLFFTYSVPPEAIGAVVIIVILSSIFPLAFIIMFATNLKHLNK